MKKIILYVLLLLTLSGCTNIKQSINNVESVEETEPTESSITQDDSWSWFISPGEYQDIKLFDENFIGVQNETGKYGFINKDKKPIVDYEYFNVLGVNENIARVMDFDNNYIYIDNNGNKISKDVFVDAKDFNEGFAAVKNHKGKWGFINTNGTIVIDCQFDDVLEGFNEGLAAVATDNNWYFITKSGDFAFSEYFDGIQNFSEGLAGVEQSERWGFIDTTGGLVIDYKYDSVGQFKEGKASVSLTFKEGVKWAYINKNNEVVIDFRQYDASEGRLQIVGEFVNDYALVTDTLYCLIDKSGKTVLGDNSYLLPGGAIYNHELNLIVAYDYLDQKMINKKFGFINIDGIQVVPFIFNHASNIYGDLSLVSFDVGGEDKIAIIRIHS